MRIALADRSALLTYCTNVHPADDLMQLVDALDGTAANVARAVSPDAPFGIGLRLGEEQLAELADDAKRERFERVLRWRRLFPFTINGFPQARFHARRVKDAVYRPAWSDPARTRYTLALARELARWLPHEDRFGTISTVPLGWRGDLALRDARAVRELWSLVAGLAALEQETGAHVMVCLEPEPGCTIETVHEVIDFFESALLPASRQPEVAGGRGEALLRRHLGVCYDLCHQAVLFASAGEDLAALRGRGIEVGKVQISNALRVRFPGPSGLSPLVACDEERFLHQVALRPASGGPDQRFGDLPDLEAAVARGAVAAAGEARCHFHVPVYAEAFPPLETTRADLVGALEAAVRTSAVRHFEVETYTFDVLPDPLRSVPLESQLVREIEFAKSRLASC